MVAKADIEHLINAHLSKMLLIAEASLSASQFQAFRKLTLNEFGKHGLGEELERLFGERTTTGKVRLGQE